MCIRDSCLPVDCFYVDLLCPLISGRCNGRVNDGYSTMSDGIFDGIFAIVHRTFLLSYFRGCWLMDFSCAQSMWTYNEAAIELAAAVFCKRLQEHQAMSFVTKRLDSFLYLSRFTAKINTTVCSSRLFSTDLERGTLVRVRSCKCHVFELFVLEHNFGK